MLKRVCSFFPSDGICRPHFSVFTEINPFFSSVILISVNAIARPSINLMFIRLILSIKNMRLKLYVDTVDSLHTDNFYIGSNNLIR